MVFFKFKINRAANQDEMEDTAETERKIEGPKPILLLTLAQDGLTRESGSFFLRCNSSVYNEFTSQIPKAPTTTTNI